MESSGLVRTGPIALEAESVFFCEKKSDCQNIIMLCFLELGVEHFTELISRSKTFISGMFFVFLIFWYTPCPTPEIFLNAKVDF